MRRSALLISILSLVLLGSEGCGSSGPSGPGTTKTTTQMGGSTTTTAAGGGGAGGMATGGSGGMGTGGSGGKGTGGTGTGGMGTGGTGGTGAVDGGTGGSDAGDGGTGGSDAGDAGTGGSDAGDAGTGGSDAGDAGTCATPSDCPAPPNECQTATCNGGHCGTIDVAAGTVTTTQVAGDCHQNRCDGLGNVTSAVDNTDLPPDTNACTTATCTAGVPSTPPKAVHTSCGNGMFCDGNGTCVGCVVASDCPGTDTDCATRTCTSNACGLSFAPAGKVTTAQTPGDCHQNRCDGAGNVTSAVDDTDLPVDNNPCTGDVCTAGVPSNPPVAGGTPCGPVGGPTCDGNGTCMGCSGPTDCPGSDTDCAQRTCTAGACGQKFTVAGTPTTAQTPGDCHQTQCDGAGNATPVVDDTDVPVDNNACTGDVCTAGVPSNPALAAGTTCAQNGGVLCNGAGTCVQCVMATDCPGTDTDCAQRACTLGVCSVDDVVAGTPTSTQTPGDCHRNQCDGAGNIIAVIDNTDVPGGSSTCSVGSCTAGVPGTMAAAQGTACAQNGGVLCDGKGACSQTFTVVRIGTGGAALASTTTAVFLETYYPVVGATPVVTPLPTAVAGSDQQLTLSGTATSEGGLSRSSDGHYLSLAGYAAATGVATTGTVRVVGRVDATFGVDTTTRLATTAFAGSNVRGATSVDGTNFWVSGTSSSTGGGVWYVALGATGGATMGGTQIVGTPNNMRMVNIFAGQLYGDSGSSPYTAILTLGTGLPTATGTMATAFPGMPTSSASPYGFVLFDLDSGVPGLDTLFVADSSAGVSRWTSNGTTWTKDATFTVLTAGCYGVTGWSTGAGVVLIATTTNGTVQRLDVPTTGSPTATLLVTEGTNTTYRGVALAPH